MKSFFSVAFFVGLCLSMIPLFSANCLRSRDMSGIQTLKSGPLDRRSPHCFSNNKKYDDDDKKIYVEVKEYKNDEGDYYKRKNEGDEYNHSDHYHHGDSDEEKYDPNYKKYDYDGYYDKEGYYSEKGHYGEEGHD